MSDPFAHLPSSPNGTGSTTNAGQKSPEPSVSVSDIQDFISPKLYSELSWDKNREAEAVTKGCIERAIIFAQTLLHLVDKELDLYSKTQQEIVKTLTVYELYIYNGDKNKARVYMERAERLMSNRYGSAERKRDEGVPVVALCLPQ